MNNNKIALILGKEQAEQLAKLLTRVGNGDYIEIIGKLADPLAGNHWKEERDVFEWLKEQRDYEHIITAKEGEDLLGKARWIFEKDYKEDVDGIVEDVCDRIRDGEITDSEDLDRYLHESVDGTQRVIYTALAMEGVMVSRNDGYAFENGLLDTDKFKDGIDWSAICYWALHQDVIDELEQRNIDVNSPVPDEDDFVSAWYDEHEYSREQLAHIVNTDGNVVLSEFKEKIVPKDYLAAIVAEAKERLGDNDEETPEDQGASSGGGAE